MRWQLFFYSEQGVIRYAIDSYYRLSSKR